MVSACEVIMGETCCMFGEFSYCSLAHSEALEEGSALLFGGGATRRYWTYVHSTIHLYHRIGM
jgi:hypothetical protein